MPETSENYLSPRKKTRSKNSLIVEKFGRSGFVWRMTNSRSELIARSKTFSTRSGAKKSAMSVAKNKYRVISVSKK